jgi:hypothetical protein
MITMRRSLMVAAAIAGAETAALASCLDLIITVDTSVAHLAGALGRPTWILLPYTPPYRWLLNRHDNPVAPERAPVPAGRDPRYGSVLDRVRDELQAQIAAFRRERGPNPAPQRSEEPRAQIETVACKYRGRQQDRAAKRHDGRKWTDLDFAAGGLGKGLNECRHWRPPNFDLG